MARAVAVRGGEACRRGAARARTGYGRDSRRTATRHVHARRGRPTAAARARVSGAKATPAVVRKQLRPARTGAARPRPPTRGRRKLAGKRARAWRRAGEARGVDAREGRDRRPHGGGRTTVRFPASRRRAPAAAAQGAWPAPPSRRGPRAAARLLRAAAPGTAAQRPRLAQLSTRARRPQCTLRCLTDARHVREASTRTSFVTSRNG